MADGSRIQMTDGAWIGLFTVILFAWAALLLLAAEHPAGPTLGALSPTFDTAFWQSICRTSPRGEPYWYLLAMWGLMALAMMLPTAVPTIAAYDDLVRDRPGAALGTAGFSAGYAVIWLTFAGAAALVQQHLATAALLSPHGISISVPLSAALLIGAGLYQFSPLKARCLTECRSPMGFLLSNWRGGLKGAFQMGLRHGAICVGCCWALMLLALVGGTMNLIWMGGAMVLMILEKLPDIGERLTKPLGALLILAGVLLALRP